MLLRDDGSPALYAEEVREQAARIGQLVPAFQSLILELGSTDRILLDDTIDEVVTTIEDARAVIGVDAEAFDDGVSLGVGERRTADIEEPEVKKGGLP